MQPEQCGTVTWKVCVAQVRLRFSRAERRSRTVRELSLLWLLSRDRAQLFCILLGGLVTVVAVKPTRKANIFN